MLLQSTLFIENVTKADIPFIIITVFSPEFFLCKIPLYTQSLLIYVHNIGYITSFLHFLFITHTSKKLFPTFIL